MGVRRFLRKRKARLSKDNRREEIVAVGGAAILDVEQRVIERSRAVQGVGPLAAIEALVDAVFYIDGAGVPGDMVEFGTATGRTSFAIACAASASGLGRRLHLFDSFEGLPEIAAGADVESPHAKSGIWTKGGCFALNRPALVRLLKTAYLRS